MVEPKSEGAVRLNKEDVRAWEKRLKEVERRQKERQEQERERRERQEQ
jgi:hypothetical protein